MANTDESPAPLPAEIVSHYEGYDEAGRLFRGAGQLERARTQAILQRYLPPPPAVIYDIGGGPGAYACWLARQGYTVHLVDITPLHVEQARCASQAQPDHPLASCTVGDARRLSCADSCADAVLLFGPLYHLTERVDRVAALRAARRILRPGGYILAAAISRFASALDGLMEGFLADPEFARIVERDLADGQHRNPTRQPNYFTTAYFYHPAELRGEMEEAGLQHAATLAVEGLSWLAQDFDEQWQDPQRRAQLLQVAERLEAEISLMGVSPHLLAVARKILPAAGT